MELRLHKHTPQQPENKKPNPFTLIETSKENSPGEIYGQTCISYKNSVIVFGGSDKNGKFSDAVFILDTVTKQWSSIAFKDPQRPKGRHFHTAELWKDGMYVFGGKCNGYMNDFNRFDLITHTWSPVLVVSGKPPSKRFGHTTVIWGNAMWVYGGFDDFGYKSDELYQYRFDTKMWHKITYMIAQPTDGLPIRLEKYQHAAVVYNDAMYIFGGRGDKKEHFCSDLLKYCFNTSTWAKVIVKGGKIPTPRWGHSLLVFEGKLYLTGGCDFVLNFNDVYKFKFKTSTWIKLDTGDFNPRFFHSACIHNNSMVIYAGRNMHDHLFDSLYSFQFDPYFSTEDGHNKYMEDIKQVLLMPDGSDITFCFVNEGNKYLYAHKGILMIRCEAFKMMFSSGMKESNTNIINITTDSFNAYFHLLYHIYTGTAVLENLKTDQLIEILQLADRYFINSLKVSCEKSLKKCITAQNLTNLYEIALKSNANALKHYCIKWASSRSDFLPALISSTLKHDLDKQKQKK